MSSVINSVGNSLTGKTGSGAFAGSITPTLVTPVLGAATATTLVFNPTTGGIIGTTTNNNTNAGNVGEYAVVVLPYNTPVSLSTGSTSDVTSLSLTAGDWDIWGNIVYITTSTTNITSFLSWLNTTSATQPDASMTAGIAYSSTGIVPGAGQNTTSPGIQQRLSLASTTTVYLSTVATFSVSTLTAFGNIQARRAR